MRLAWFSPMPPVRTGVAACSAELVAALSGAYRIDVYVDEPVAAASAHRSAHEFVWRHRLHPYDLVVYQLGNSSHHDYIWPYLFRYPGLTVLHDAHLHHARAAALLRTGRAGDYRAELTWNHPEADGNVAELAINGFDNHSYYFWPMTRMVVRASRVTAVHTSEMAERLREDSPAARVESIHLGHGEPVSAENESLIRAPARAEFGIPPDAIVFGCYGGLTPDKRVPQLLAAFAATRNAVPSAHLLLAGATVSHYDLAADVARHGLQDCTTITGYLSDDADLTAAIAAADVVLNLRWPTAREVSGPWLRALAAGKPTVVVDLAHLTDVPTLDPRTWQPNVVVSTDSGASDAGACAVAIDILDEDHSLRLAMRRLANDPSLRATLGRNARAYWQANHSIERMVADYQRVIALAAKSDARHVSLPPHVLNDGTQTVERIMAAFGLPAIFRHDLRTPNPEPRAPSPEL